MHESCPALGVAEKSGLRRVGGCGGANKSHVAHTASTLPSKALWIGFAEL